MGHNLPHAVLQDSSENITLWERYQPLNTETLTRGVENPSEIPDDEIADNTCGNGDIPAGTQSVFQRQRNHNSDEDCCGSGDYHWRSSMARRSPARSLGA